MVCGGGAGGYFKLENEWVKENENEMGASEGWVGRGEEKGN